MLREDGAQQEVKEPAPGWSRFLLAVLVAALLTAAWPQAVQAAARSVDVYLANSTGQGLTKIEDHLDHGIWPTNLGPPASIAAFGSAHWRSESSGVMTGTEGWARYSVVGLGEVWLYWNNPYYGSNSYNGTAPPGYSLTWSGGGGDNATITFTLQRLLSASCTPASATVAEGSPLDFTLRYVNGAAVTSHFTAVMAANAVFGSQHALDSVDVGPGFLTRTLTARAGEPGPGSYRVVIWVSGALTGNEVLATCDFTLTLTTRAPRNTGLPQVSGTAQTGEQLTCAPGTWDRAITATGYRWLDDTGAERGAGATYVVSPSDEGRRLSCEVRVSNSGGSTTARSPATVPVVPRDTGGGSPQLDQDGDGVPDQLDRCPTVPRGVFDTDGDGCVGPYGVIAATPGGFWNATARGLMVFGLYVDRVPARGKVEVICRGRRCAYRQTVLSSKGGRVRLKKLKNRLLHRGERFQIRVTAPGFIGQVHTLSVKRYPLTRQGMRRANRNPFTAKAACLPAGSLTPAASCPVRPPHGP